MSKINLAIIGMVLVAVSIGCKSLMPAKSADKNPATAIDFTTPGKGLDVRVQLDKKQTASATVPSTGGSVSLTSANGSKFTLDVPANALETETKITMTAVQTLDGAPLDKNTPTAVQLEPSGLFFKEMATLTIVPAQNIPVKEQVMFVYEGEGKDYHLALIDPRSKEIKLKLMEFSGAGVASASDSAWAATLMVQANDARSRIQQKLGEYLQNRHREAILGDEYDPELGAVMKAALDQFEDEVVMKEMVAAELDCKHGKQAIIHLFSLQRDRQLLSLEGTRDIEAKIDKLTKIIESCLGPYRVSGESNGVSFTGEICRLIKPFSIDAKFPGGTAKTSFSPNSAAGGTTTVSGGGGGCVHSGGGTYSVSVNKDESGTITWTTSDTIACPGFSNSRTVTFTLPLPPAPELSCP